jgi:ATP-dependent DNA ligase
MGRKKMPAEEQIKPGLAPMEARLVDGLPSEAGWQFEPKWDGFRCLAFRARKAVALSSKSGKPLNRFFPEVVDMLARIPPVDWVLDGELIIPIGDVLSFEALQARLHPAASRVRKLAAETPAQFMLFDCLRAPGSALHDAPLSQRRAALEDIQREANEPALRLSPCTLDPAIAEGWLRQSGGALDGVIAKRLDAPYTPGERSMLKVKQRRTADCVVGGFRYDQAKRHVASLLLGLYDDADRLNHVGFTSAIANADRPALTTRLEQLIEPPGFTGRAPGGQSRWSTQRSTEWQPLRPGLVAEVVYDQVTGDRFRHGTRFLRWRPDKRPDQCRMDQLQYELRPAELDQLIGLRPANR